jgi:hypothetical protein
LGGVARINERGKGLDSLLPVAERHRQSSDPVRVFDVVRVVFKDHDEGTYFFSHLRLAHIRAVVSGVRSKAVLDRREGLIGILEHCGYPRKFALPLSRECKRTLIALIVAEVSPRVFEECAHLYFSLQTGGRLWNLNRNTSNRQRTRT